MEIAIVLVLALVALSLSYSTLGLGHFLAQESYGHALNAEKVAKGEAPSEQSLFYNLAAFAYSRVASASAGGFDVEAMSSVLRFLPGVFALVAAVGAYFALRGIFTKELGAASALLAIASMPFASAFLANVVSPNALGIALFFSALAFLTYSLKKDWLASAAGGILAGLAVLAWPGCALAYAAFVLGLVAEAAYRESKKERDYKFLNAAALFILLPIPFVVIANPGAVVALLSKNEFALAPSAYLLFAPFAALALIAAIAKALGRHEMHKLDVFVLVSAIASMAIAPFALLGALPGFLFACAAGLMEVPALAKGRNAALGLVFLGASYAMFAVLLLLIQLPSTALVFGVLIGAAATFAASMYEGKHMGGYLQLALFAVVAFASLSSVLTLAHYETDSVGPEMDGAFAWVAANTSAGGVLGVPGDAATAAYLAQRPVGNDTTFIAGWLLGNAGASELKAHGINYIVLDGSSVFDGIESLKNESGAGAGVRMESFIPLAITYDQQQVPYVAMNSANGDNRAYIPLDSSGALDMTKDAILIDASGSTRNIPAARFEVLKDADGRLSRIILPYDNFNVNLFKLFFGSVDGLVRAYPAGDGTVRIFRVV